MRPHLRAPSRTTFVPLPTFMYRYSPRPRLVNRKSRSAAAVPTRGSSMRCKIVVWSCAHVRCWIAFASLEFVYCILFLFVPVFSVVTSSNFFPVVAILVGVGPRSYQVVRSEGYLWKWRARGRGCVRQTMESNTNQWRVAAIIMVPQVSFYDFVPGRAWSDRCPHKTGNQAKMLTHKNINN